MKGTKFLFGFFFITVGTLIFIDNFNHIYGAEELWRLWPLILILLGVSSLITLAYLKNIMMSIIGIISALTIFSSMQDEAVYVSDYHNEKVYSTSDTTYIAYDAGLQDTTFLSIGAGAMNIDFIGSDDTSLVMIESEKQFFQKDDEDSLSISELEIEKTIKNLQMHLSVDMSGNIKMFSNNKLKHALFHLHKKPIWNLNLEGGASSFNADLSSLKVSNINVGVGASDVSLKLGNLTDSMHVDIDGGVAKFHIDIPDDIGCRISHESALTNHEFPGFIQKSDLNYETPNYQSSKKKITIQLETGISSISVKTYKQIPPVSPVMPNEGMKDSMLQKLDIKPNKQSRKL